MSQLQKSLQSIETGRYLLTWIVSRADLFFFAYRCLDFVTSAHEPLERTSLILESLLPEFAHEATDNDPTVVEHRTDRVFRSMRPSDKAFVNDSKQVKFKKEMKKTKTFKTEKTQPTKHL